MKGKDSSQIARELNKLSEEVNSFSSFKTGTQCRYKWHNLLNYKRAKDSSTKSGGDARSMKSSNHSDQMNGFRPINTKSHSLSSGILATSPTHSVQVS